MGRAIDLGATDSAAAKTKLTEAEPLLVDGYEGLKAREELIHIDAKNCLIETLQRLVALYTAWDKPDEATKWQKELDAKTDNAPATSPNP